MTVPELAVRPETPADLAAIRAVHTAAFPTPAEAALVKALRAAGRLTISFLASEGGAVVGHVGFSPVTVGGAPGGLGLAPLAVLPSHQRRGIGSRLVRDGLDACRAAGVPFVVVLGEPAVYGPCGFEPAPRHGLSDEYGGGDAFQVIELTPGGIPPGGGRVEYAPEFAMFGGEPAE